MKWLMVLLAVSLSGVAGCATAQELHKTHGDWKVLSYKKDGEKFCYVASVPTKKTGNYTKRDEPFFLVVYRAGTTDEVSVSSGYPYKAKSTVKLSIDKKAHKLFTQDERAWAYDAKQDATLIAAMKKGSSMEVRGTSKKGTYSADTYSLRGITAALADMSKRCKK